MQASKKTWAEIAKDHSRLHRHHEGLEGHPLAYTEARVSRYEHTPSRLLPSADAVDQHSLSDVTAAREKLSIEWVNAFSTCVSQKRMVPGEMIFLKEDTSLLEIVEQNTTEC